MLGNAGHEKRIACSSNDAATCRPSSGSLLVTSAGVRLNGSERRTRRGGRDREGTNLVEVSRYLAEYLHMYSGCTVGVQLVYLGQLLQFPSPRGTYTQLAAR